MSITPTESARETLLRRWMERGNPSLRQEASDLLHVGYSEARAGDLIAAVARGVHGATTEEQQEAQALTASS